MVFIVVGTQCGWPAPALVVGNYLGRRALIHRTRTKSSIEFLLAARVEEI